ncbi:MAG: universal stress protein [Methylococcales bacterium]|nr:universal stress protein [Methylococcales bacterium]
MSDYKHILVAIDFTRQTERITARALSLAGQYQATLYLLHVVETLPVTDAAYGPVAPFDIDLTEQMQTAAQQHLADWGKKIQIPTERQWLELGSPKQEIVRIATARNIDLIVVGSHGRHGLSLLLGSTATGVLHHAPCDVLAVRIREQ